MDYLGRVAEIIVAAVLLFLVPLNYMSVRNDLLCQTYVTTETAYFVDSVRNIGFLDRQMYEEFVKKLAVTKVPYEIEMSHYRNMVGRRELEGAEEAEASYFQYYKGIYQEDLMEEIQKEGMYLFNKGDFFSVSIEKRGLTLGDRLAAFLTGRRQGGREMQVVYGGAVRDEIR